VDSLAGREVEDVDLGGLGLRRKESWRTGRGEGERGRKTHSFGAHGVWYCYEQLFGAFTR